MKGLLKWKEGTKVRTGQTEVVRRAEGQMRYPCRSRAGGIQRNGIMKLEARSGLWHMLHVTGPDYGFVKLLHLIESAWKTKAEAQMYRLDLQSEFRNDNNC